MKKVDLLFLASIVLFTISCKDESKSVTPTNIVFEMPPYTDTGADVLAYKANGTTYRSYDYSGITDGLTCMLFFDLSRPEKEHVLYIEGKTIEKNTFHSIRITIQNANDTGRYFLKEKTPLNENQGLFRYGKSETVYYNYITTNEFTGYIDIKKIDTVNKIIAGRFKFKSQFNDWGVPSIDTFNITEGQFDLIYYQ